MPSTFSMLPYLLMLIGLLFAVGISPLLTFSALFQQKEWRIDRLTEHLRREGAWNQLFGKIRPPLAVLFFAWQLYEIFGVPAVEDELGNNFLRYMFGTVGWIVVFGILSGIQIILKKQRTPKWTSKAILITSLSIVLSICAMLFSITYHHLLLPFAVLLQPLYVLAAWIILLPVDYILKKRVMDKARALRSSMKDVTVIGIAGSVGKTTAKELLAHITQDLKPMVTPAHVNTEMGVAQWLLRERRETRDERLVSNLDSHLSSLFIIEMGAYRKGEISLLCSITQPTIGVMTALGSDHLALFGSEEAIVEANGELVDALGPDNHLFLYGENDGCKHLASKAKAIVHLTGSKDLQPTDIVENAQGIGFKAAGSMFHLPLQGRHNLHNVLLAIGVARHLGISDNRTKELLKTFRQIAHTFNVRTERGVLLLDDTYNISPLSVKAALEWAAKLKERPRALLTSGLQETGKDENRYLMELGEAARSSVERVIFTNAHGADVFAKAYGKPVEVLASTTERVQSGSALLCLGRMPLSNIQRLLPQ
jgi:UDP-N-acetylmuramyl pentapeptide synthase